MPEDLRLAGVLETVLYYASDQQDEMERFYENVLGLESLGLGRWSLAFRLGPGVVLLFDRERSAVQDDPPPHGASGSSSAARSGSAESSMCVAPGIAPRAISVTSDGTPLGIASAILIR